MAYMIKTYTFDGPVPVAANRPFGYVQNISFSDAEERIIYLDDDEDRFEAVHNDAGQGLLIETELGGVILSAGTKLTYNNLGVAYIRDTEMSSLQYYVFFPHQAGGTSSSPAIEVGDRTTVMIVPALPSVPPFDPSRTYNFVSAQKPSTMHMAPTEIPPSYLNPPCFTAGTLIDTARGPRPVESLRAGDLVVTRDRGPRPLRWTGARRLTARMLDIAPNLRPVRIRAGALGPGLPGRDLTVSPQHRVLVRSRIAERLTGAQEALVPAIHLCAMPGIAVESPVDGIEYLHLLFDRHEIVRSDGCWTESLFTGPQALRSLTPAGRREIRALFPGLFAEPPENRPGARPFITGREARELTRRHLKHARPLVS